MYVGIMYIIYFFMRKCYRVKCISANILSILYIIILSNEFGNIFNLREARLFERILLNIQFKISILKLSSFFGQCQEKFKINLTRAEKQLILR